MRRSLLAGAALSAAVGIFAHPRSAWAVVPVEQIEAPEQESGDAPNTPTGYAPVDFNGSTTATSGSYSGITFHGLAGLTNTFSSHASAVANNFYGSGSVGAGYTTTVYNDDADAFFGDVNPQASTGTGPLPGAFASGARIINNSYIADGSSSTPAFSNVDAYRRLDYMIAQADTTFVTAAVSALTVNNVTSNYALNWSAFNSLAVTGSSQTFDPAHFPGGAPGKTHADLFGGFGDASFTTATVSSYALGLYGNAQAGSQPNAQHSVVIRSLLMSGADKTTYTGPFTTNHLSVQNGAGTANYVASLAILQAGQQQVVFNGSLSTLSTPTPSSNTKGWAYATLAPAGNSYLTFHSSGAITGITAALNWDVTQSANTTAGTIDTSNAGNVFPNVGLEVVPLTAMGGNQYTIGTQSDPTLLSILPAGTDNEQFLSFSGALPAGDYAFEFIDDPNLATNVGFSYTISEVPEPGLMGMSVALIGLCVRRQRKGAAL